ncbi:MAG: hypothetical protein ACLFPQ_06105 [Candidatus Woesearchaeota archaeon]
MASEKTYKAKDNPYHSKLAKKSDSELVELYRSVEFMYSNQSFDNIENTSVFKKSQAAVNILKNRHGMDFVAKLTNIPSPQNRLEKLKNFLFRRDKL